MADAQPGMGRRPISAFIQPTASGDPQSGCYGDARSGGIRFHEGIDIKAVARDRRGEPLDQVFAAMAGVVRYVNHQPGDGSYGRYIVIEHPDVTRDHGAFVKLPDPARSRPPAF